MALARDQRLSGSICSGVGWLWVYGVILGSIDFAVFGMTLRQIALVILHTPCSTFPPWGP